jgi:Cys/Met metabolism PLP-dependent enzyme
MLGGLEGGEAVAFSSGMAACAAVFGGLPNGAHVLLGDDCYQGVAGIAEAGSRAHQWHVERLPATDPRWVQMATEADLLWVESPSNPLLDVADVAAICASTSAGARGRHRGALGDQADRWTLRPTARRGGHHRHRAAAAAARRTGPEWGHSGDARVLSSPAWLADAGPAWSGATRTPARSTYRRVSSASAPAAGTPRICGSTSIEHLAVHDRGAQRLLSSSPELAARAGYESLPDVALRGRGGWRSSAARRLRASRSSSGRRSG